MRDFPERKPIMITRGCAVLIDVLQSENSDLMNLYWNCWKEDLCESFQDVIDYDAMAQEFIDQLHQRWCAAFAQALRDKLDAIVKDHEEKVRQIHADRELEQKIQNRQIIID